MRELMPQETTYLARRVLSTFTGQGLQLSMSGCFSRIGRTVMSNRVLGALSQPIWLAYYKLDSNLSPKKHTDDPCPKDRFRTSMASLEAKRPPLPIRPSVEDPLRVDML